MLSIDWYAVGQTRSAETGDTVLVVRFMGHKGRRPRIATEAPAGAILRNVTNRS